MAWELTDDVEEFRRAADGWLVRDTARSTVLLTVCELVRRGLTGPARFGWWRESTGAEVTGAFLQTSERPPVLGPMTAPAAVELARVLRRAGGPVPGVQGGARSAAAFAGEWAAGGAFRNRGQWLLGLGRLTPPVPVPEGRARRAAAVDVARAVTWMNDFAAEVDEPAGADLLATTTARIADGRLLFWEVDGVPVSMAGMSPMVAGQVRIGPVYTPRELRGHGYAAGVTAAVSEAARQGGADEVLLFTEAANPTSNALYERLGYRRIAEFAALEFSGL